MTGALQLFLRANTATTSFRPKGTPGWSGKKHEIRIWGPNDLGFGGHILQTLSGPRSPVSSSSVASFSREKYWAPASESSQSPIRVDNKTKNTQLPLSNPYPVTQIGLPSRPNQNITAGSSPSRLYKHKPSQSYSLFPNEEPSTSPSRSQETSSIVSTTKLPSSTFMLPSQMDLNPAAELQPPPALFVPRGHRRDSSMISSATVQIGIRLTYMEEEPCPLLTETQKAAHTQSTNSKLGPRSKSPALQIQTENLPSLQLQLGYERLSLQERAYRMKTLPPVPRPDGERIAESISNESASNEPRLSPTIYTPPNRSNTGSTKRIPDSQQDEKPRASKANWIWVLWVVVYFDSLPVYRERQWNYWMDASAGLHQGFEFLLYQWRCCNVVEYRWDEWICGCIYLKAITPCELRFLGLDSLFKRQPFLVWLNITHDIQRFFTQKQQMTFWGLQ